MIPSAKPAAAILLLAACHRAPDPLEPEALRDPEACQECHPDHYREWSGSMHAYASVDPVFRAMEAQGQALTGGELGDFCVKCHAPAAVALGQVAEGADLDALSDDDPGARGVTCWFCHQVDGMAGDPHNNPLTVADDDQMRGPIGDPVETYAHRSAASPMHDREDLRSSDLCGTCHDIVNPMGTHIERTYAEWQGSVFDRATTAGGLTCAACHMQGRDGVAAEAEGVRLRRVHDHAMPGVDLALTDFPEADEQRAKVQELLDDTVNAWLCVGPPSDTTLALVTLENVAAGHGFPSGATADRRAWVEIVAYQGDQVLYESGRVAPGEAIGLRTDADDPDLWRLWSRLTDPSGAQTHHFWDAAEIEDLGLLKAGTAFDPNDPAYTQTHISRQVLVRNGPPDRIEAAVHVQPVGLEVLDQLVAEAGLDPAVAARMETMTLQPTILTWTPDVPVNQGDLRCVPEPPPVPAGRLLGSRRRVAITACRASRSTGLTRCTSMPASAERRRSSSWPRPVSATMVSACAHSRARSRSATS
ncbi:MAG: multiheme c-type cytochrome [Bryobacterales bacterium]